MLGLKISILLILLFMYSCGGAQILPLSVDVSQVSSTDVSQAASEDVTSGPTSIEDTTKALSEGACCLQKSGTRIKAEVYTTSDGAVSFVSWYDTKLAIECAFLVSGDGQLHCLPDRQDAVWYSDKFADSKCTKPVVGITTYQKQPHWVLMSWYSPAHKCSTSVYTRVYHIGKAYTGPVYQQSGTDCVEVPADYVRCESFYLIGDEVPPAVFQKVQKEILE